MEQRRAGGGGTTSVSEASVRLCEDGPLAVAARRLIPIIPSFATVCGCACGSSTRGGMSMNLLVETSLVETACTASDAVCNISNMASPRDPGVARMRVCGKRQHVY